MSYVYGNVTIADGVKATAQIGDGGISGVLLGNDSGLNVKVVLEGCGISRTLYAGYVDFIDIPQGKGFNGNVLLYPTAILTNASSWPSSFVGVDVFGTGERPTGTYPVALQRANNIGNKVTTVGGTATSIQNDGNAASTSLVEATPTTDPTSAVSWTVGAVFKNGNQQHPGTFSIDNGRITTDGSGNITIQGTLTANGSSHFDNNKAAFDGNGNLTLQTMNGLWLPTNSQPNQSLTSLWDGVVAAHVSTYAANELAPQVSAGGPTGIELASRDNVGALHRVISADPSGTEAQLWINTYVLGNLTTSGNVTTNTLNMLLGSMTRISKFTAAVTITSTFFNHGLGVIPDIVMLIPDGAAAVTNRIVECEYATMTTTQCKLTAGASFNVVGLAIKF